MRKKDDFLKDNEVYDTLNANTWVMVGVNDAMSEYADEFACAFADYLVKNYQPRFPNKGEWVKIIDSNKFKRVYTTTELLEIFKKEQDGK